MKLLTKGSLIGFLVCWVGALFEGLGSQQEPLSYFASGAWDNARIRTDGTIRVVDGAVSVWGGGHVGPCPEPGFPVPSATTQVNGVDLVVRLESSAIGQLVAGGLGYPGASAELKKMALAELRAGAAYATTVGADGEIAKGPDGWKVRFPGVLDEVTGQDVGSGGQNYFEEALFRAEASYRAAMSVNPMDAEAARGILVSRYHRMVAQTFAGNQAVVVAASRRLVAEFPLAEEISILETFALPAYARASAELIVLASRDLDSQLVAGNHPLIPANDLALPSRRLIEAYARAIRYEAEATHRLLLLSYLAGYRVPVLGHSPNPGLIAKLDQSLQSFEERILLANALIQDIGLLPADLNGARQHVQALRNLRESVLKGNLAFVGSRASGPGLGGIPAVVVAKEYPPEFVPFDARASGGFTDSFNNLLARAIESADRSKQDDLFALQAKREFEISDFRLKESGRAIRDRYFGEMGELAGLVFDSKGQLVPDLARCPAAPGDREKLYDYPVGTSKGRVYEQWKAIALAELDLEAATSDLNGIVSRMRKKQEVADTISNAQDNLITLILDNGEKLAGLDIAGGEAQAASIRTAERIRRQENRKGALFEIAVAAGTQDWTNAGIALLRGVAAEFSGGTADVDASLARQLSQIQAQKTRIHAQESAQIQLQQRNQLLLQTEEALHSLFLDAERAKLNILLAEQRLDMANRELKNSLARIQFLFQEYLSAVELETSNPLSSPDYRLTRDLVLRDAEDSFILAQEAAFLAVKAAQYRINGALRQTGVQSLLQDVLSARRGAQLVLRLALARSEVDSLFRTQGAVRPEPEERIVSLRNFVFQRNYVVTTPDGQVDPSQSKFEAQTMGASSEAAWLAFLQERLVADPIAPNRKMLDLVFSTSLNCLTCNGGGGNPLSTENPLFSPGLYNGLIQYDPQGREGRPAYGVQIAIRGRALVGINPNVSTTVTLRQEGASYVRSRAYDEDPLAVNIWNLQPLTARLGASLNGYSTEGAGQLHERSPANDRWRLQIREAEGDNQRRLLLQLDKITDIEIRFFVSGFQFNP